MTPQVIASGSASFWRAIQFEALNLENNFQAAQTISDFAYDFENHAVKYREAADKVAHGNGNGKPGPQRSIKNAVKAIKALSEGLNLSAEHRSSINLLNPSDAELKPLEIESKIYDLHNLLTAFADRFDESAVVLRKAGAKQQQLVEERRLVEALFEAKVALDTVGSVRSVG